jgi:multiple antibiotic resistance protein
MDEWTGYIKIFTALLTIVNPIGAVPIFVGLTENQSTETRKRTARIAGISAGVVLTIACLFGGSLLRFFGISVASFQVAGGILLLVLARDMFHAQQSPSRQTVEEAEEAGEKSDIGVVPFGIPLLAGPGAISTVIIFSHQASNWLSLGLLMGIITLIGLTACFILYLAIPIGSFLGKTGINIATRVMGLLLAAVAVEFIAHGVVTLIPKLA